MSYITVLLKKEEMRWTSFIRVLLLVNGLRSLNSNKKNKEQTTKKAVA